MKLPALNEEMHNRIPALRSIPFNGLSESPSFHWGGLDKSDYTVESGFFKDACWIDKRGIYRESSLRDPILLSYLETYQPPCDIIDDVLALPAAAVSKYAQPVKHMEWDGIVLLAQSSIDHSIGYLESYHYDLQLGHNKYIEWYKGVCSEYGPELFVKLHPFVNEVLPVKKLLQDIGDEYGCTVGSCHIDIINTCKQVIFYNSTAIVDCWMRDVPYKQYAPGTFDSIPPALGRQMVNFLMWKYCIPLNHSINQWLDIFDIYTNSTDTLWPLLESLSWGQWAIDNLLPKKEN